MAETQSLITNSRHPFYTLCDYEKFRLTYKGGREFIDRYLEMFNTREDKNEFERRKKLTHNPRFAGQSLDEMIGGITQRMPEIIRSGVTDSYTKSVGGFDGGVDLQNHTMDSFVANQVLPELMIMGRTGVYIDMPQFNPYSTLADFSRTPHPYLYPYNAYDILNWRYGYDDKSQEIMLQAILLRERHWIVNEAGLPEKEVERFRLCQRTPTGVLVRFFEQEMVQRGGLTEKEVARFELPLTKIPFKMYDIGRSLLTDAADIQIGLLNLASADLNYAINANFPFYVEGYDPKTQNIHGKAGPTTSFDDEGNELEGSTASGDKTPTIGIGTMHGRLYPYEAPPPAFIHPSPEPLRVSMEKQEQMKEDIRRLLNLNVANVAASRASAESKKVDQSSGLEAGLAFIGLELEGGEQFIAQMWGEYEGKDVTKSLTIAYPTSYSLKTDDQRIEEAKKLGEVQGAAPSRTYQKEVAKLQVKSVLDGKVNTNTITKINKEIDAAKYATGDWQAIKSDYELGIVDAKTAAEARGYDPELVEVAQKERIERMAQTAIAQSEGGGSGAAGQAAARGGEGGGNPKDEKTVSQDADKNPKGGKAVRGKGE